jgi:hypothetical protein
MPFALMPTIHAIQNDQHITIILSDTCRLLIDSNSTTHCPTYEDILMLFTDTSDKTRSGNFTLNEKGFLERGPPQMKNHREYYRYTAGTQYTDESNIYWIDPPADLLLSGAKKIVIEADNFIYPTKVTEINDTSIEIGANRYVSTTCSYSIITAANWVFLLGDTMRFMAHDCDKSGNYTFFNDTTTYYWERTKHNIEDTAKWKYEQLIKNTKERCSVRCNEYDTVGQNMTLVEMLINNTLTIDEILPENVTAQQYLCKKAGPLCDFFLYRAAEQEKDTIDIGIIENITAANNTLTFNATLSFTDEMFIDHVVVEPDPCEKAGPLCDYYRYQNINHTGASSSFVKHRNALAGAIGE